MEMFCNGGINFRSSLDYIYLSHHCDNFIMQSMKNRESFYYKLYLQSIVDMTIEAEKKSPLFYYFPITSLDLAKYIEVVKDGYERNILPVNLLWKIIELKKKEQENFLPNLNGTIG